MPFWKVLALSAAGFTVPVVAAVIASPFIFPHTDSRARFESQWLESSQLLPLSDSMEEDSSAPFENGSVDFRTIATNPMLDPRREKLFIASVVMRFSELPAEGSRERVFYKYASAAEPYPGWGFAVRRLPSSMRPEVYWQGISGRGGWYTFAEIDVQPNTWYSFTFLVQDGRFLSLYWQRLPESDADGIPEVTFSGGFEVSDVDMPSTDSPLQVAPLSPATGSGKIFVRDLLVAQPPRSPGTMQAAFRLLNGGARKIASRLKESEVGLWLTEDGQGNSQVAFGAAPAMADELS